jgi:hypothetical protein
MLLLDRARVCGAKWVHIAAFFPGRTDIQIKNRYLVLSRRRKKELQAIERASAPPLSSLLLSDAIPPFRPRVAQEPDPIALPHQTQWPIGNSGIVPGSLPSLAPFALGWENI